MSEDIFRCEADAQAGPVRESLLHGRGCCWCGVRLFNGPCVTDDDSRPDSLPDAYTDLRPEEARRLALGLLQAAEDAETRTLRANWWQEATR
jgi:hypothetical protein